MRWPWDYADTHPRIVVMFIHIQNLYTLPSKHKITKLQISKNKMQTEKKQQNPTKYKCNVRACTTMREDGNTRSSDLWS